MKTQFHKVASPNDSKTGGVDSPKQIDGCVERKDLHKEQLVSGASTSKSCANKGVKTSGKGSSKSLSRATKTDSPQSEPNIGNVKSTRVLRTPKSTHVVDSKVTPDPDEKQRVKRNLSMSKEERHQKILKQQRIR